MAFLRQDLAIDLGTSRMGSLAGNSSFNTCAMLLNIMSSIQG